MRVIDVLQKCLGDARGSMHALRRRVLLCAVEATIHGRRLILMDQPVRDPTSNVPAQR